MTNGLSISPLPVLPQASTGTSATHDAHNAPDASLGSIFDTRGTDAGYHSAPLKSQNIPSSADKGGFGKLLDSHTQTPAPSPAKTIPAPIVSSKAPAAPAPSPEPQEPVSANSDSSIAAQQTADSEAAGTAVSAAPSSDAAAAVTLLSTLVLTQLQASGTPQDSARPADGGAAVVATASSDASTGTNADTLTQLQQLLQQLLQLAQQSDASRTVSTPAPADVGAPAKPADSASTAKSSIDADADKAITQILNQLATLLPQLAPQAQASAAADAASTGNAPVAATASDSDAALLAQLTRELGQKLNAASAQDAPPSGPNAKGAGDGAIPVPASFDATLSSLQHNASATDKLQSLLTQVSDLLTAPGQAKQDGSDKDNASANANAGNAFIPAAAHNQATPDTGFAKLVSDSASSPATPAATQVAVQIKNAVAGGASQIKIQLSPEDMGKVVVQLTTSADGKTGVTVTADNRQTLALLQNEARSLEASLRDIGLKTDSGSLNFNLSGQQQQQQSPGKNGGYTQVAGTAADDEIQPLTSTTTLYRLSAVSGLDIRV